MVLLVFFVIDCIFFTFTWSSLITRRETVFVLFLSISPICLFLTGFSWPQTAIPPFWQYVGYIFPSTFGCRAFINLNTAGGSLSLVAPEIKAMTIQTVIYYVLSSISIFIENKVIERKDKIESLKDKALELRGIDPEEARRLTVPVLLMQGIATAIDALSVGLTLTDHELPMALLASLIISAVTFVICLFGLWIGKRFGSIFRHAEVVGGIILILIGIEIFVKNIFF